MGRDVEKNEFPPELHPLFDASGVVRQRILTNTFLRDWTAWWSWILIGLVVAAALSAKMAGAMVLAAILTVVGAGGILVWVWRTRLSIYDAARRLDSAAGFYDRVSTAIFLGTVKNPDEIMQRQRRDAVARMGKVEPRGLFPIRMPSTARRALVLVLAVAGLLAYRWHHEPPLVALLKTAARSQLVQSVFSPIVNAMEKGLQRTITLVSLKPQASPDEIRPGNLTDDPWQNSDEKGNGAPDAPQDSLGAGAGEQSQDQLQQGDDQNASSSAEMQQQENSSPPSQQDKIASGSKGGNSEQQSQASENKSQSLGQTLMQGLKNMLSNSQSKQSNNRGNQESQQQSAQAGAQSGNDRQSSTTEAEKNGKSQISSDAQQKASQSASNGAGNQKGLKEMRANLETHPVKAVPDRVALEASGVKDETRMRASPETGSARLATRDISPQTMAVINGAEQENIPARYRLYVQHYFEHADNGQQ